MISLRALFRRPALALQRLQPVLTTTGAWRRRHFSSEAIVVPAMGDSITEGEIVEICKKAGDRVAQDDLVAVLETDKVSVDVRSSSAGKVISVSAAAGDVLKVGAEIMKLDTESAADTDTAEDAVETNSPHEEEQYQPLIKFRHGEDSDSTSESVAKPAYVPLIRFRYGAGRAAAVGEEPAAGAATERRPSTHEDAPANSLYESTPPQYARRPLSEEEIASIESGGASLF